MNAEVVPQGRNELFFNELDDFNPAPPRKPEGVHQRLGATCGGWSQDPTEDLSHLFLTVPEPSTVPERYVPPHRRNIAVEPTIQMPYVPPSRRNIAKESLLAGRPE